MKAYLLFFLIIIFANSAFAELSWDKAEENLRNYRSFRMVLENDHLNSIGVEGRSISGSGQFALYNIQQIKDLAGYDGTILIIDLRLESHGFINTLPVAWKGNANLGKSVDEVLLDEIEHLHHHLITQQVEDYPVYFVASERESAIDNGFEYERLPVQDHSHPTDSIVDNFLNVLKAHPEYWIHVHCAVGRGRTTLFMAMYDMYYNAKDVSFDDILERQKAIGGQDLKKYLKTPHANAKKQKLYLGRLAFLERFYQFCQEGDPQAGTWQEWIASQPISL